MNAELKAKWIKALRSGEFKQARGTLLSSTGGYCCLGVLMKVQDADMTEIFPRMDDRETSGIPSNLRGGLRDCDADTLAEMNDGARDNRKHSFPEIADYIEKNL